MVLNNCLLENKVFLKNYSSKSKVNKSKLKKGLFFAFFLVFFANAFALDVPALKGRVNDYANVISKNDEKELTEYLASLDEQTGIQIAVLTIPSLKGEDIAAFGVKVAENWKLGKVGEDNGALLLVAMDERELRIEVGYGLEGLLTDAKCGLIIRNVIIPEFKDGNYSDGIVKGVQNMGGIASGNAELVSKNVLEDDDDSGVGIFFMIIWVIFIFVVICSKGGIFKWIFLSNLVNNGHSVHHHSNLSGFGGFSGGHGGGFSGGGGHFGGGGASGHW